MGTLSLVCFCLPKETSLQDVCKNEDLTVPQGPNEETLISTVPAGYENIKIKKIEPKGTFKMLQDKGIKITDYHEDIPK